MESEYDKAEADFLVSSFRKGFDIGYHGPLNRKSEAANIPLTIGTREDLWEKIMKEVKAKRVAGPYEKIPFNNYIQSLVGLVPKAGGKTRMIFHLSYHFSDAEPSVNECTPKEWCSVRYNDLDTAVQQCLELYRFMMQLDKTEWEGNEDESEWKQPIVFLGKTDLSSAFCVLPLQISCICWLIFKAIDPADGKMKYFVEKCLPFSASISCSHYQRFSNALKHILQYRVGKRGKAITNYLDDFLFLAIARMMCNQMIQSFLKMCMELNVPVAIEKTEWADWLIVFLGILLDGCNYRLCIPLDKQEKALKLLNDLSGKKKVTVHQLQVLTGYLNFLTKAIFAGRTFTHRMYAKFACHKNNKRLKAYHHVRVDDEFRFDCEIWTAFLIHHRDLAVCRPMVDLQGTVSAEVLNFYSDTSASKSLGFGAIFNNHWLYAQWEEGYIQENEPTIEYLELFALTAGLLTWGDELKNIRMVLLCDNMAVVGMINKLSSSCSKCMALLRLITLDNLVNNRRVFARYVKSSENGLSDALSRLQFSRFWKLAQKSMNPEPSEISKTVWPASKIWSLTV